MRNINLIIYTLCMFELVCNTPGEVDERCKVGCACCKDGKCGQGKYFSSDECTLGCIDGYRGARCYKRCTHNCTKCERHSDVDNCIACNDGYYPGSARDCTSKCLPGCKTCTSGTTCTSCMEGFYDINNKCNRSCPFNCITCSSNNDCGSCKDGYYKGYQNDNINFPLLNDCTYKCRDNCLRCSSYDRCSLCKTGFYGPNCEKNCSTGCLSNSCDMHTGNCTCFPTFAGVTCDKCKTGQYGNLCDQQCSVGCKSNVCERKSGNCKDGCIVDTIIGDKCDVCLTGWYGQNCNMSCSAGCKNQKCEKSNGECSYGCLDNFFGGQFNQCMHEVDEQCKVDCACCIERKCGGGKWFPNQCTLGCIDGYRGARCYIRCTHNCTKCPDREDTCTACYDGYYPGSARDCTSKCLPGCKTCTTGTTCTSCKEGYYNADGQSDCNCPVYCNCNNGQCVSCKDRYYDTSNLCYSLCPGNCVTCSSNNDCGSCKDGYYKGYQNDNINFPLLNDCTYKCRDNCLRCSSYDRCSLCKTGFYGPNCEKNCSTGCLSNSCDMQTGNCTCFPTFAGVRCDNCKTGKYGNMCNQECSAGCKGGVCEKESGDCTYGCTVVTIVGVKCENCSTGWYGQYCNISCSLGCKMEQCERSNGECSYGCLDNFEGRQCNQYMPDSSSTEQSFNTAGVILGTGFAVSLVLVVTLILWKCRKRANGNSTTRGPRNENSGIELECGSSANAGNVRNHGFVQESNSDVVLGSDYDNQNLGRVQVSEHECRQKNLVSLM